MENLKVPKKVNRHVLKALDALQASRPCFVSIEAITDRVRRSLRYTKPVPNLKCAVQESLRNQNELGIVTRFGSSYAMALAFKGLRSDRKVDRTQNKKSRSRDCDSLTADEIAKVRKMLRGVQKPKVKRKPYAPVVPRVICKAKSNRTIPARAQKPAEMSTPVTHHINGLLCDSCLTRFMPQMNTTGRHSKSAIGVPGMNMEENFTIPKKVNRHVLKAVRHLTEKEGYAFAPLNMIKIQAMKTMRKLNPVKDIETVIERSLTNLTNVEVLSERHQSYRVHCVQPLPLTLSLSIFGKVSDSFFPSPPSQDMQNALETQYIANMEESEMSLVKPISHLSALKDQQSSTYRGEESYFQAEQPLMPCEASVATSSSLSGLNMKIMPTERVFGMQNDSMMGICGSISRVQLPLVYSGSLSQELHNAVEAHNISSMDLDEQMPKDSRVLVIQDTQSYLQAQQTSTSAEETNMDIKPVEDVFGTEPNVENASLVGPRGGPFSMQLPEVASESLSQDMHVSISLEARRFHESWLQSTPNEADSISTVSLFHQMHNTEDRGMSLYRTCSDNSHVSVPLGVQGFQGPWLQSLPNDDPSLLLERPNYQADQSSTSAESQDADWIDQAAPPARSDKQ